MSSLGLTKRLCHFPFSGILDILNHHGVFGSLTIVRSSLASCIRLEHHLGDLSHTPKFLHFSRGWPTNFGFQDLTEREGLNADTRCEDVRD
jgi:hypothetical protein